MTFNIPSDIFDGYNDAVSSIFNRTATLVYPVKKEDCPNCTLGTMGTRNRSVSVYTVGGPYPFERGMPCPYCAGKGFKGVEATDTISLRIYWDKKSWVKTGAEINIPDGSIQTVSYMTDLDKIQKCNHMIPLYDGIQNYEVNARYSKASASFPQGFNQNLTKYVVTFWKLASE